MDDLAPTLGGQGLPGRQARVFVEAAIEVVDRAVGHGRPDDLRHRVGELEEPHLAGAERPLGPRPLLGLAARAGAGPGALPASAKATSAEQTPKNIAFDRMSEGESNRNDARGGEIRTTERHESATAATEGPRPANQDVAITAK